MLHKDLIQARELIKNNNKIKYCSFDEKSNNLMKNDNLIISKDENKIKNKYYWINEKARLDHNDLSYRSSKAQIKVSDNPSLYIGTSKPKDSKKYISKEKISFDNSLNSTDRKVINNKKQTKLEILNNKLANVRNRNIKICKIQTTQVSRAPSKDSKKRKTNKPYQNLNLTASLIGRSLFYN